MVFWDLGLWPGLTVHEKVRYPLAFPESHNQAVHSRERFRMVGSAAEPHRRTANAERSRTLREQNTARALRHCVIRSSHLESMADPQIRQRLLQLSHARIRDPAMKEVESLQAGQSLQMPRISQLRAVNLQPF
jgi:hypothetical protein